MQRTDSPLWAWPWAWTRAYDLLVATGTPRTRRGNIEARGGGYRIRVYAGVDPVTRKEIYLKETIPAGPNAKRQAEKALTRLQNQVDERRAPRTSATLDQLPDRQQCRHRAPGRLNR